MFHNFDELLQHIQRRKKKQTIAIAAAQDREVLECAVTARNEALADFILIGDTLKIKAILDTLGENADNWTIINEPEEAIAAQAAVRLVSERKAEVLMKGLLHTSVFLRAVFKKEYGLVTPGNVVSQITVTEYPSENRFILVTDCAIAIAPSYDDKLKLIKNAVTVARRLGMELPKAACIAPVETINPNMPATIDAAMLSKASQRGQLSGCLVDGPLALDNALSLEAAKAKGISGDVAGQADILLMPDLASANVLDKSLRYFANLNTGSAVVGCNVPLVVTSRSDSARNKLHAIALSVL